MKSRILAQVPAQKSTFASVDRGKLAGMPFAARGGLLVVFLTAANCGAQDLPDPGRRLSEPEQRADPEKQKPQKQSGPFDPSPVPKRDARACEGARQNYQMSCRAPVFGSNSQACAEAYAIYRQSCP